MTVFPLAVALATLSCGARAASPAGQEAASPNPTSASTTALVSATRNTSAAPTVAATPVPPAPAPVRTAAPVPTAPPTAQRTVQPTPNLCGAPKNPYGYNFCKGSLIYSPLPGFCTYFNCVSNFSSGTGAVVRCTDGTYSKTGGNPQACLGHFAAGSFLYQP